MTTNKSKKNAGGRTTAGKGNAAPGKNRRARRVLISRYTYQIEWMPDMNSHQARCLMFPSLFAHGATPEAALKQIQASVAKQLKDSDKHGRKDPLPIPMQSHGYE